MSQPASTARPLRQRILTAGFWSGASYVCSNIIRFANNLILTRILLPEMFGIMAIASTVMTGLMMISDVGLGPNVIYSRRGSDPAFLNTAWAIQIRRGCLVWGGAIAAAGMIWIFAHLKLFPTDSVYAKPVLPFVVAALAFNAIIEGLESTRSLELRRNLSLRIAFRVDLLSQLSGMVCMMTWAFFSRSIWALVAGSLCATAVRVLQSHFTLPGHPNRWQWDKEAFHEIIHFGKWIFLSSILGFFVNNGDRLLLGGMLSARALGMYTVAYLLASTLDNLMSKIIGDVAFPTLSEVAREHPSELKATYYRFHRVTSITIYGAAGIMMTAGNTIIRLLYDPRYAQAGYILEVLAIGLLTVPSRILHYCFQALGRPKYLSHIITFRLVALYTLTPLGFKFFGQWGAIGGIVLSIFLSVPPTYYLAVKLKLIDWWKELALMAAVPVGMLVGFGAAAAVVFLHTHLHMRLPIL